MNVDEIRRAVCGMAEKVYAMLGLIEQGFMEHKTDHLSRAMKLEDEVNAAEKALTESILILSRATENKRERVGLSHLAQAIEMLERMGDEASNLIERIEIKIAEHLLFHEIGVEQFNETFTTMKRSVEMLIAYLKKQDDGLRKLIVDNGYHVKELVEKYRKKHADRFVQGLGTPMSVSMYFDMLDFTGNIARHASNVAKVI